MNKPLRTLALAAVMLGATLALIAQEAQETDDEDIFGAEEVVKQGSESDTSQRDAFLKSTTPVLLGTFTGSLGFSVDYDDPWGSGLSLFEPDSSGVVPASSLALGFSAKPEKDLGFYGEIRTSYPFYNEYTVVSSVVDDVVKTSTIKVPDIEVFKLYSRFNWNDKVYFSFGKQPLKWGLGYLFTPANDLFTSQAVDFEDYTAEREGPLSLKVSAPIPGVMATAYLFSFLPEGAEEIDQVGFAPKFEMAFPGLELSAAAYYQKDDKPKAIVSASYAKNGLSLFGEGLLSFGSENYYIVAEERSVAGHDFSYRIVEKPDELFFTGTAGLMYSKSWEHKLSLSCVAQYLYDGLGQDNLGLDQVAQALTERLNPLYPEADEDPAVDMSDITSYIAKLGSRLGQHYAGMALSFSDIADNDDISLSLTALANVYDLSGWVQPKLTWAIFDRLSLSFYASFGFGGPGDEYTNAGGLYKALSGVNWATLSYDESDLTPPISLGISLSLGSGSF